MVGPNSPYTQLDSSQVLTQSFDETKDALRVDIGPGVAINISGQLEVSIDHTEDSIALGTSTELFTSTTVGADVGLDVNLINPSIVVTATDLDIRDLDQAQDSVEVFQATHDNLNGNANIQVGNTDVSNANPVPVSDAGGSITVDGTVSASNFPATVDTNYGTVGANTIRTASQIGNATGAANFNSGATGAQTLRTTSNISDGAGNLLTSQTNGAQRALDVGINVSGVQIDPRAASPGTLTDHSGTASTTSSEVMPANANRKYLLFHNLSGSTNMWINFTSAAVNNGAGSIQIGSKDTFIMEGSFISTEALNVIAGSGTPTYTAKEG